MENTNSHNELNNPIMDDHGNGDGQEELSLLTPTASQQLQEYRKSMSLRRSQR